MTRPVVAVLAGTAALLVTLPPGRALAHGGVTGVEDRVQDYAVLAFLLAVVLIGAGVLAWVMLAPQPAGPAEEAPEPEEGPGSRTNE